MDSPKILESASSNHLIACSGGTITENAHYFLKICQS